MQDNNFDTLNLGEIRRLIGLEDTQAEETPAGETDAAEKTAAEADAVLEQETEDAAPLQPETAGGTEEDAELAEIRRLISDSPQPAKVPEAQPVREPIEKEAAKEEQQPRQIQPTEAAEETEDAPEAQTLPKKKAPLWTPRPAREKNSAWEATDRQQEVNRALERHKEETAEDAPKGYDNYLLLHDLVTFLAIISVVFVFFFRLVGVSGESMIPTFYNQDFLVLESNFLYKNVERNDIVVMNVNAPGIHGPIVKRVIATEGQTVDIDFESGEVMVDGRILVEPYIYEPTYQSFEEVGAGLDYPVTVPEGCVFVMGDDRNNSTDSRWSKIGCVRTDRILGKVLFLIFPGKETDVNGTVIGKRDFGRIGAVS